MCIDPFGYYKPVLPRPTSGRSTMPDSDRPTRRQVLAGAGAGVTALAGCLGAGQGDESNGAQAGGGSTAAGTDVTVEWWHAMGGNLGETVDRLATDFNAQSDGVTVETSYKGDYYETLSSVTSAIKAGTAPAVAQILDLGATLAIDSEAFQPIGEVMDIDWSRYHDPVIEYYTFDGTVHSLPFNSSNPVLYYNRDAFEEAGLDPEDPPGTFAEVRTVSERLVETGATEQGISVPNVSWMPEQWFAEDDQTLVNERNGRAGDPTEANFDTDTAERVFRWWTEMYEDDLYPHTGKGDWGAASQAFLNEQTGMFISSTAGVASTTEGARENGFELGTGYLPVPNEGTRTGVVIGGASLWMTTDLDREVQRATQTFFEWLSEPEQQAAWHRGTGYFPITEDAVDTLRADDWFEDNPNFRTAFDQLNDTEVTPATRGFQCGPSSEVRDVISAGHITMINGDVTVEEHLGTMKSEIDGILRDYIDSKG